jgi:hypothetical protein
MKVPKRIFFYWGNETMSWLRYMTLKSCRFHNPDWEIVLYYCPCNVKKKTWKEPNQQDFFNYKGDDYLERVSELQIPIKEWEIPVKELTGISASHKSNFFKWNMLATEGGIYADMDILFIKSLDSLYERIKKTDVGICSYKWVSIGFLHSNSNSQFFKDVFNRATKTYTPQHYQCAGVQAVYSLLLGRGWSKLKRNADILGLIKNKYNTNIYNYSMSMLYHYTFQELEHVFLMQETMPKESIGIHWYAGHPLAQEWNNRLTENNFADYNNTITKYAKECYV